MAFEQWCIVEIMGHQRIAGRVTEEVIGGQGFIRVDVPQTSGQAAFTKYYGPGAIYAITPTDEETAKRAAESFTARPIEAWRLMALPAPVIDDAADEADFQSDDPDADYDDPYEDPDFDYNPDEYDDGRDFDEPYPTSDDPRSLSGSYDPDRDDAIPF